MLSAVRQTTRQAIRRYGVTAVARHGPGCGCGSNEDTVVDRCTSKIKAALNPVQIEVTSSNTDPNGNHIFIKCVSEEFTGKNIVQRQKLVYKAIWDELEGPVHAVDGIVAKTPKEVGL